MACGSTPADVDLLGSSRSGARRVLVVQLDGAGDVLLAGPAVRAVARTCEVTMLCGPAGASAARLLPGVSAVLEWAAPWVRADPPPVRRAEVDRLVDRITEAAFDEAIVLTSFHQSPLPIALLLREAGIRRIAGASVDHAGALLDVRLQPGKTLAEDVPEPERMIAIAAAAGYVPADDGGLAVRTPPPVAHLVPAEPYVVVHPGATAPARRWPAGHATVAVGLLAAAGRRVVVTGDAGERSLTAYVAGGTAVDLGGRTSLAELSGVLAGADAVVVGNTAVAHLAAAVGTPVVALFSPVVPARTWAPYRVPHVLLGDQRAPCRDTRARQCPIPGHPCLAVVAPATVVAAVATLAGSAAVPGAARPADPRS